MAANPIKESLMSNNIVNATDASFEADVLQSTCPVLVDFWAEWCNPCKQIAPLLNEIADEMGGTLRVVKVNADENKALMERYSVRGLPSLLLYVGGEEKGRLLGLQSKTRLMAFIEDHVEAQ
ncbi:thioredoxin [Cupriavidus necator]